MRVRFQMLVKPVNLVRENGDLYLDRTGIVLIPAELLDNFRFFFFTETRHKKTSLFFIYAQNQE
jgi:hypothetical protein